MNPVHVIMIDNFDSFTYNCVDAFFQAGALVEVYRNHVSVAQLQSILDQTPSPKCLVLSPGPGRPGEAGFCLDYIKAFSSQLPIFGICLGHQAIAQAFGGKVIRSFAIHGEATEIRHHGCALFQGVPKHFKAGRYHSLTVTVPKHFVVTAQSKQLVMAMRHRLLPIYGLQFHPESVLTDYGQTIIQNMIKVVQHENQHEAA